MFKITDLEKDLQEKLTEELHNKGIDIHEIKDQPLGVREGNQFVFRIGDYTVIIPAPSQGILDSLWDKIAGVLVGAGIVLATTAVILLLHGKSQAGD